MRARGEQQERRRGRVPEERGVDRELLAFGTACRGKDRMLDARLSLRRSLEKLLPGLPIALGKGVVRRWRRAAGTRRQAFFPASGHVAYAASGIARSASAAR